MVGVKEDTGVRAHTHTHTRRGSISWLIVCRIINVPSYHTVDYVESNVPKEEHLFVLAESSCTLMALQSAGRVVVGERS